MTGPFILSSYANITKGFLVNDQRDAQFFLCIYFIFLTLYMFRARCARNMYRVKNINKYIEKIVRHFGHLPRIIT